jgi:hypothetical protein
MTTSYLSNLEPGCVVVKTDSSQHCRMVTVRLMPQQAAIAIGPIQTTDLFSTTYSHAQLYESPGRPVPLDHWPEHRLPSI